MFHTTQTRSAFFLADDKSAYKEQGVFNSAIEQVEAIKNNLAENSGSITDNWARFQDKMNNRKRID